jgi:F-type H+-transporting ATPase subunit a
MFPPLVSIHPRSAFQWLFDLLRERGMLPSFFRGEGEWPIVWFNALIFSFLIVAGMGLFCFAVTRDLRKVPGRVQNLLEAAVELLQGLVCEMVGPGGPKYLPLLGSVFLYIFLMNLAGLIPGFVSPTMTVSTTAAMGVTVFVAVQYFGIRSNGIGGYLRHFAGEIWWLAPLMFVIHVLGELAKPLSLSLRLYGNIFGEENVINTLIGMAYQSLSFGPISIPVQFPMSAFAIFTSFLQAFIFTALSCIYIAGMTAHEGGHGEAGGEGGAAGHGAAAHALG